MTKLFVLGWLDDRSDGGGWQGNGAGPGRRVAGRARHPEEEAQVQVLCVAVTSAGPRREEEQEAEKREEAYLCARSKGNGSATTTCNGPLECLSRAVFLFSHRRVCVCATT